MQNIPLRAQILLSTQCALWGMVYPAIRAIAIGYEDTKKFKIVYYLDREPNEDDYENISEVVGEICSDIPFKTVEENCIFTLQPFSELDYLNSWVYMRKEE